MTKEKLPKEYLQWMEEEKNISDTAYLLFKAGKQEGRKAGSKVKGKRNKIFKTPSIPRFAAAAVLILALGTTMWVKKDDIFKPKYTEEQIALSYEHAVKALAVCASSLSQEIGQLKKLNQIPELIDNQNN